MKLSISLTFLLALFLTACSTLEVGLEMTPASGSPGINQPNPAIESPKEKRLLVDPAPMSVSPTTASTPTARPTSTLVPTQKASPTPSPLPPTSTPRVLTATPPAGATISPSPSQTLTPASSSIGSKCDRYSPYELPTPAFFFRSPEGDIYYMDQAARYAVDQETFANLGYGEKDIASGISDGTQMGYPQGVPFTRLLKGSGEEVYWLENGFRRHIPDMDTFRQLGYRPEDIFQVPDNVLRSWPRGESLPSVLGTPPEPLPALSEERVVMSYRPLDRIHHASELYTVYTDGRNPRRLSYTTGYASHADAAWSPDGRSLAFVQNLAYFNEPSKPLAEIFTTDPDHWIPQRLAESGLVSGLVWSPDGTRLIFTQVLSRTVVMDMASGDLQPMAVEGWTIALTPDGRLAFWTKENETTEKSKLMVMDADGQNVQPVEGQITVFDQRYFPWRQCKWVASDEPPWQ